MRLINREEIEQLGLLQNTQDNNFSAVSYDLTAKEIITLDNKIEAEYSLPPQGMVVVVTQEEFNLHNRPIVGFTTVKNSLSRKGIMAVNIGLVDPGYVGPISSILINFGKSSFPIKTGDAFLRMTFHRFAPLDEIKYPNSIKNFSISHRDYVESRRNESNNYLDPTFLYLKEIQKKASESAKNEAVGEAKKLVDNFKSNVETTLKFLGIGIAAISLSIAAYFNYQKSVNSNETLDNVKSIEKKMESLEDSIHNISIKSNATLKK